MKVRRSHADLRYDRRLPFYAAVGSFVASAPVIGSADVPAFALSAILVPVAACLLVAIAIRKKGLRTVSVLSTALVFASVTWAIFHDQDDLHRTWRWSVGSQEFKKELRPTAR